jgi:exosortase/archaeosortase family protein
VLLGGWAALPWAWPAVLFLFFLLPLPHRLEVALAGQLQWFGSRASTFLLQALGFVAFTEGNVIRLGEIRLEVAPACSGLSMLHVFFALSTAAVLVLERPWYEKVIVFLSAVPIALFANVTRITVTAILHRTAGSEVADLVFHDLAGWLMMLLALGLLWVELRTFSWVVVTCSEEETSPVALTEAELDPAAAAAGVVPLPLPAEEPEPLQAGSSLNPLFLRPADAGADLGAEALKRPASSGPVPLVYLPTRPRKDQQSG